MFRLALNSSANRVTMCGIRRKHTLPDLPYDYNALEPAISADIMKLHHQKHHATYVNMLNQTEDKFMEAQQKQDLKTMIALGPLLRFNGGGHMNHSIFWQNLSPNGGGEPQGELMEAIKRDFGGFENMKSALSTATVAIQGSGWGWLAYNKTTRSLAVATCANQDPLEPTTGCVPLFGIDIWEHAYYLQYKNSKADYVKSIFNVANWKDVGQRFNMAKQ